MGTGCQAAGALGFSSGTFLLISLLHGVTHSTSSPNILERADMLARHSTAQGAKQCLVTLALPGHPG